MRPFSKQKSPSSSRRSFVRSTPHAHMTHPPSQISVSPLWKQPSPQTISVSSGIAVKSTSSMSMKLLPPNVSDRSSLTTVKKRGIPHAPASRWRPSGRRSRRRPARSARCYATCTAPRPSRSSRGPASRSPGTCSLSLSAPHHTHQRSPAPRPPASPRPRRSRRSRSTARWTGASPPAGSARGSPASTGRAPLRVSRRRHDHSGRPAW